ncbi:MAG TPA: alpha/beta hydrolase [Methanoregula sp.]|nr:alpha/beta hydrolase [Methanoregula sp.]
MIPHNFIVAGVTCMVIMALFAGCTGSTATPSYSVDKNGVLSVTCAPVTSTETVLVSNETYTKSRFVLHTTTGDVVTYLSYPKTPKAVMVYIPGASETIAGHEERMVRYAKAGYAFMFIDTRGRGGETPGYPFNPSTEYAKFKTGNQEEWPGYYLTICDISSARALLSLKFGVPVYAVGGSNGGRYAAVAAGVDKNFAGYVGISTAEWGLKESVVAQGGSGDILRFAESVEPGTYLPGISPRPVWMFHNATDPIIPFAQGKALFATANEPKKYIEFSGDHGINPDVDRQLIALWAQIYGTQA